MAINWLANATPNPALRCYAEVGTRELLIAQRDAAALPMPGILPYIQHVPFRFRAVPNSAVRSMRASESGDKHAGGQPQPALWRGHLMLTAQRPPQVTVEAIAGEGYPPLARLDWAWLTARATLSTNAGFFHSAPLTQGGGVHPQRNRNSPTTDLREGERMPHDAGAPMLCLLSSVLRTGAGAAAGWRPVAAQEVPESQAQSNCRSCFCPFDE